MLELNQVGERSYYINCPAKIGIYKSNDTEVYLIDSGNDKDAGRKVRKILSENGWNLKGIINTHSNADHIGGNKYLQQQTGCKIFADGIEAAFTRHPILEPSFLYGGYPCKDLRHKFLLASESDVSEITDSDFPKELEVIPLHGHFFDMIGIRTPDDVTSNITGIVQLNRQKVFDILNDIQSILKTPMCFEELLMLLFDEYGLVMNFEQYVLVGSTVRSYLAWLKDNDKIRAVFTDNQLMWSSL